MKYYAVTKGSYSDYHIIAITADHEKAVKLAEKFTDKWDTAEVEEYEESDILFRDLWCVRFNPQGDVTSVEQVTDDFYYDQVNEYKVHCYTHNSWIYVFANSMEEAIKIAAEKRAEYLAAKIGLN